MSTNTPTQEQTTQHQAVQNQTSEAAQARQAASDATQQAKEMANQAATAIQSLDLNRKIYLGSLAVFALCTLLFSLYSFEISSDHPVTETQRALQRKVQAKLNAASYGAFYYGMGGKLFWLAAVGGIAVVVWSAVKKPNVGWVPLAEVGCAAAAFFLLVLVGYSAFPNTITTLSDGHVSRTLLGYWLPFLCAGAATYFSTQRILQPAPQA